jgi:hypothetical protein
MELKMIASGFWSKLANETSLFPRGESQRDSALSGSPLAQLKLCTAHLPHIVIYDCIASETQSLLKKVSFPLYFDSSSVLCTYFAEIKSGDTSKSCIFLGVKFLGNSTLKRVDF